ncbi:MAG: class I SAM-dependent methyltransferase [Gammaproteobacteria bacterium]|nr:class I SAM-dependent methyltransferase [Gammaproteobacteria bacterium]
MTRKSITLTDDLYDYLLTVSLREPETLRRLREETAAHPMARMQIAPEQGQFMQLLVRLMQARAIIEVGTFTGYSTLWMATALPPDGRLIACDTSDEYTAVARRYWREAGVDDRIDLRIAPALETLDTLIHDGEEGRFDLAFIDADKTEYPDYYERVLRLLRRGGLVIIDNTLWEGQPADPSITDKDTSAIRAFNESLLNDKRVSLSLLPVADGISLALKN